MIIAKVVGNVVSTIKEQTHHGCKILLVQPVDLEGAEAGETLLALDGADAGVGDRVLIVQEGWSAAATVERELAPIDAAIIGVVDSVDLT